MPSHSFFYVLIVLFMASATVRGKRKPWEANSSYAGIVYKTRGSMEIDLSFQLCNKPQCFYITVFLKKRFDVFVAVGERILRAEVYSYNPYKVLQSKNVSYSLNPLTSSCSPTTFKRSVRVVVIMGRLTVTLLPLVFQASVTLTHMNIPDPDHIPQLYPLGWYTYVVNKKWTSLPGLYFQTTNSHLQLPPVGLAKDLAKDAFTYISGQTYVRMRLTHYNFNFMQIAIVVMKQYAWLPFRFNLERSGLIVTVEISCAELKITYFSSSDKMVTRNTSLDGDCDMERTVVVQYYKHIKRLTLTVLPLTSQGFLMEDHTEAVSRDFEQLCVYGVGSKLTRPWKVYIISLDSLLSGGYFVTKKSKESSSSCLKGLLPPPGGDLVQLVQLCVMLIVSYFVRSLM